MPEEDNTPDSLQLMRVARVRELLQSAAMTERAPQRLRERVAELDGARTAVRGHRPLLGGLSLGGALVAALAALVVITASGQGAPSLAQAATLAQRGPDAPGPGPAPGSPYLLAAQVGGLSFPSWRAYGGWRSVGERRDRLGDRSATTVYYSADGRRIAYTILSAPALPATDAVRAAGHLTLWRHGRAVVVWDEDGHTCLLSGAGLTPARLWWLASRERSLA
jgi:hypothetical protein